MQWKDWRSPELKLASYETSAPELRVKLTKSKWPRLSRQCEHLRPNPLDPLSGANTMDYSTSVVASTSPVTPISAAALYLSVMTLALLGMLDGSRPYTQTSRAL